MSEIDELKKQLASAAEVVLDQIINTSSPSDCPERTRINLARIHLIYESMSFSFECQGNPDLPVCRGCTIRGVMSLNASRGGSHVANIKYDIKN